MQPAVNRWRAFSLSQLPWGVIGVGAVIVALALGAMLLLRNARRTGAPVLTSTASVAATGGATDAAVGAVSPTAPTPTAQATVPNTAVPPTSVPPPSTLTPIPPIEYKVKAGDTCGGIATDYSIPLSVFLKYNKLDGNNCLIRVGDKVLIPPPTPTAGPSPTLPPGVTAAPTTPPQPTATLPPQIIYQVKSGDTCSDIADKYRITVDTLVQQNNLDANCTLQIGQELTLTFAIPTPAISPTPIIAQTPTARSGFDAPVLTSPQDGVQISDTQQVVTLQWLSAGLLKNDEWYVVQIQPSGAVTVPVYETKATSIKITRDIFGDQPERSFAWWVQIKQLTGVDAVTSERQYNTLGPPSAVRRFAWHRPDATPTPASATGQ